MNQNFKINFIGIGAPRCGTTWIARCLDEHPEISLSIEKETHFFDEMHRGESGLKYYEKQFPEWQDKVVGEFTPAYYLDEDIAKTVKKYFPDVKILVSLRNPVDRAFSHHFFDKRIGKVRDNRASFLEIMSKKGEVYEDGFYYHYLSKFFRYFEKENISVMIYDDIIKEPVSFMKKIYRFLGVDDKYVSSFAGSRENLAIDTQYYYEFMNKSLQRIRKWSKDHNLLVTFKKIGLNKLGELVRKFNRSNIKRGASEELDTKTRQEIYMIYKDDIRELEGLINRDLSLWKPADQ